MDPKTMMMLATLLSGGLSAFGGNNAKQSSSFGKNQLSNIDDMINQVRQMRNQGKGDVTQNQGYQTGQNYLMDMFNDPNFFQKFESPMMQNFEENIVPSLANRFASQGSGGSLGSTGFRNQLAREGSNLQTNLAALRGGMQQNAIPQLLNYAQQPVNNLMNMNQQTMQPTQNQYQPANAGPFGDIFSSLFGGMTQAFGNSAGNQMFAGQNQSTM